MRLGEHRARVTGGVIDGSTSTAEAVWPAMRDKGLEKVYLLGPTVETENLNGLHDRDLNPLI